MKKFFTGFFCMSIVSIAFAQGYWQKTSMQGKRVREEVKVIEYYTLNLGELRNKLNAAELQTRGAKAVEIMIPTVEGKVEKFAVYSSPVAVPSLIEKFQIGSYVGVGIDDPAKHVRFSVAPNDFQSMIIKDGKYEFLEPINKEKTVYGVHLKTVPTGEKPFQCLQNESILSKQEIENLFNAGKRYTQKLPAFDKKFRTMRLALSTTGEYTTYFGGVAGAVTQMNATITRVNGVLEKDLTLQLILQDLPNIIFTNPLTDPYSIAEDGAEGVWSDELTNVLKTTVGNDNFDIGHLFGATGGGGYAGCIGCVCSNYPNFYKGSGFTSPLKNEPFGDSFDIDFVAHEIGHQLGANHTFSHKIESTGANVEPGSGSSIMGYAGITSANVQKNSDPYYHHFSIVQIEDVLAASHVNCDIETPVTNTPPVIAPLSNYTIPKGTAFVLTADVSDMENDPLTYNWEEIDAAESAVLATTGTNITGPMFRSVKPSLSSTRYFPKLTSVLNGILTSTTEWESVPLISRDLNFAITVRDNSSFTKEQQVSYAKQKITVGAEGPFKIVTPKVYNNTSSTIFWDYAKTDQSPYNVSNVKIDYTTDDGSTWNRLSASTPNDGNEVFDFSYLATGTQLKVRISALGNIFYTINPVLVTRAEECNGLSPTGLSVLSLSSKEVGLVWESLVNANYIIRYKKVEDTNWTNVNVSANQTIIDQLEEDTLYEAQISGVCSGTPGAFSSSINFRTKIGISYCNMAATNSSDEYISNVTVGSKSNDSGQAPYSDFSNDLSKVIPLITGSTNNTISVSKSWTGTNYSENVNAWIDFNRNGIFENTEKIFTQDGDKVTPVSGTFSVPVDAVSNGKTVKMRVALKYGTSHPTNGCTGYVYGEVEDYRVLISPANVSLATEDVKTSQVKVFPNPANDYIQISKVNENSKFIIYAADGKLVAKGNLVNGKTKVSQLPKGVYLLTIETDDAIVKTKFIKN